MKPSVSAVDAIPKCFWARPHAASALLCIRWTSCRASASAVITSEPPGNASSSAASRSAFSSCRCDRGRATASPSTLNLGSAQTRSRPTGSPPSIARNAAQQIAHLGGLQQVNTFHGKRNVAPHELLHQRIAIAMVAIKHGDIAPRPSRTHACERFPAPRMRLRPQRPPRPITRTGRDRHGFLPGAGMQQGRSLPALAIRATRHW